MSVQTVATIWPAARAIVVKVGALLFAAAAGSADTTALDDAIARVHYAYYTNDLRSAQAASEALARIQVDEADAFLKHYQLAVAAWRLAELHTASNAGEARRAASRCEDHTQGALKGDPRFVEAHVIQALCRSSRGDSRLTFGLTSRKCDQAESLQTAKSINARNPRTAWAEAYCAYAANDSERAYQHAQRALQLFEDPASQQSHSEWGHAEANLLLAQIELQRGNRAAARNHIEQALVIAPDYVQAKALLSQIGAAR